MLIDQAFLFFSVLSLHTGFGFALGLLGNNLRYRSVLLGGIGFMTGFLILVYLPSCLVILGLKQLASSMRFFALVISMIAVVIPLASKRPLLETTNSGKLWNAYPVASMMLIAAWSLITFFNDGTASGAPLALAATIAALAVIQRQYQTQ